MQRMSRSDVLEMMAYDLIFGLPDKGEDRKLPTAPIRKRTVEIDPELQAQQYHAFKAMFGR